MEAFVLDPQHPDVRATSIGAIICEEVSVGGKRIFHKGHVIQNEDMPALQAVTRTLHAVRLGPDDIHENQAGRALAELCAGPGLTVSEPRQSRVNLIAQRKGLLRIDADRMHALNRLPGVAVFTLPDRLAVLPGKVVAGAKITPVAIDRRIVESAQDIRGGLPLIEVKAFKPIRVGVVITEGLEGRVRDRFQEIVRAKIGWYGSEVIGFADLQDDPAAVAHAIETFIAAGAELILTGGGNTIDPLDPTLLALAQIGGEMVSFGAPAHPGSMFWLAYRANVPIFNLASCSMYSKATSADLVLPWIMAGERVTQDDMAGIGLGGLLEGKEMAFRFPPYEAGVANDDDG